MIQPQLELDCFDVVYSCAVDHHIPTEAKADFFRCIQSVLHPGGFYISADVLLTDCNNQDEVDRIRSVTLFHAVIVDEALKAGQVGSARISYQAWRNELQSFDEYKVSPRIYRRLLTEGGWHIVSMRKIGPQDGREHGIYVSVFQKPPCV